MTGRRVSLEVAAIEDLAARVRAFCEDAGLAPAVAFRLELVLEEIVVNILRHGYGGAAGLARIDLERTPDGIRARIADESPPFDPTRRPEVDTSAGMDERAIGGLGVHLVRSLVDELTYQRVEGRNVLSFLLAATEHPEADA